MSEILEKIKGHATPQGTIAYAEQHEGDTAAGHFSDFLKTRIRLSSIGMGTFPGEPVETVDAAIASIISRGLQNGINVVDTSAHYRYGRSLMAAGAGIRDAIANGVSREAMFIISKGGFLTFRGGPPQDIGNWFKQEIEDKGLGTQEDLAGGAHLMTPEYIDYQIELSRHLMGLETLDAFLIDQPEVHIKELTKDVVNRKMQKVFVQLEKAVEEGRIRYYGISTFDGFRVETDNKLFQSITSMQGLAEKAAQEATGNDMAKHHFKLVEMPFNQVMLEAFTRFNQATGQGNVASTLQAAHQLGVYTLASHSMFKGHLATQSIDVVTQSMPMLANPAQRAIQFNRSTPGLGTSLVGISTPEHLDDVLSVAKVSPMERKAYLAMYQGAQ